MKHLFSKAALFSVSFLCFSKAQGVQPVEFFENGFDHDRGASFSAPRKGLPRSASTSDLSSITSGALNLAMASRKRSSSLGDLPSPMAVFEIPISRVPTGLWHRSSSEPNLAKLTLTLTGPPKLARSKSGII